MGLFRLDFFLPAQKTKKWILEDPIIIETKSAANLSNDARLQLKNYLISLPRNYSKELKNVRDGILINWKSKLDVSEINKNTLGTELELWSLKAKKFSLIQSNLD